MTLYIYNTETNEVVAKIHGGDNPALEAMAAAGYGDTDRYGWTYSPALGTVDGLIDRSDAVELEAAR
jgi:hypothetical protein